MRCATSEKLLVFDIQFAASWALIWIIGQQLAFTLAAGEFFADFDAFD
jgi:hypothetical protein